MNKKIIISILSLMLVASLSGCGLFETVSGLEQKRETSFSNAKELEDGMAYVWHHDGADIKADLEFDSEKDVFFTCITGDYNFKKKELEEVIDFPRSIWIDSDADYQIPTVTNADYLVYVSEKEVPETIVFERFADYGYTIGISNLEADKGGHYYLPYAEMEKDDYKYYIDMKSDAAQLAELELIEKLYLDKVEALDVNENTVSKGGTVLGLVKDQTYICEFYTGTYYQDFLLKANIHSFGSLERFESYEYEFMHSNFIVIHIPEYFKSGYYFVNGVGLFRYITEEDLETYNGLPYDKGIDWNDPIILYNEDGTIKYDPSNLDSQGTIENISDPGIEGEEVK